MSHGCLEFRIKSVAESAHDSRLATLDADCSGSEADCPNLEWSEIRKGPLGRGDDQASAGLVSIVVCMVAEGSSPGPMIVAGDGCVELCSVGFGHPAA